MKDNNYSKIIYLRFLVIIAILGGIFFSNVKREPVIENSILYYFEKSIYNECIIQIEGNYLLDFEFEKLNNELYLTLKNTKVSPEICINPSKYLIKIINTKLGGNSSLKLVFTLSKSAFYDVRVKNYGKTISITFRDSYPRALFNKTIIIDPGHGAFSEYGYDCGAIGYSGLLESGLNLKIAIKLKELLEERGAKVILTRDKEFYQNTPLHEQRIFTINDSKGNLFVSIHQNFAKESRDIRGAEIYYCNYEFENLSLIMLDNFCKTTKIPPRRICKEDREIIKEVVNMPAIIVECAFMSNPEDETYLQKANNYEIMAYGIQNGIIKYFENE